MPSHPDRVRKNYIDIELYRFNSHIDHNEIFTLKISTAEIASTITRHELAAMLARKVYNAAMKNDA